MSVSLDNTDVDLGGDSESTLEFWLIRPALDASLLDSRTTRQVDTNKGQLTLQFQSALRYVRDPEVLRPPDSFVICAMSALTKCPGIGHDSHFIVCFEPNLCRYGQVLLMGRDQAPNALSRNTFGIEKKYMTFRIEKEHMTFRIEKEYTCYDTRI